MGCVISCILDCFTCCTPEDDDDYYFTPDPNGNQTKCIYAIQPIPQREQIRHLRSTRSMSAQSNSRDSCQRVNQIISEITTLQVQQNAGKAHNQARINTLQAELLALFNEGD